VKVCPTSASTVEGGYAFINVADNGIGIDEAYLGKIFQAFQRLNPKSEYEGSGIGLSICKRIVDAHDGSISVKSEPGEGSVFTVMLPTLFD
jgi:signal transduction histidine kinase